MHFKNYLVTESDKLKGKDVRECRELESFAEFERICDNPPKYLQNENWFGYYKLKFLNNGDIVGGLISRRSAKILA